MNLQPLSLLKSYWTNFFPSIFVQVNRPPLFFQISQSERSPVFFRSSGLLVSGRFDHLLSQGTFATASLPPANPNTSFLQSTRAELQQKIYTPEPETQKKLDGINRDRAKDGKPPLDFQKTTQDVEAIMNDPKLSKDQKEEKIKKLAKELGLDEGDMKELFTERLGKLYEQAAEQIKNHIENLEKAVKQAEELYGEKSPQALAAKNRLSKARAVLEPTLKKWESKAEQYKSMFPSFWQKFCGFFKKIGEVFSKIMDFVTPFLKFIPGIGQMISMGWSVLKGVVQAIQGNWKGLLQEAFSGLAKMIPGVGDLISKIPSWVSKIKPIAQSVYQATQGNFTGLLRTGFEYLKQIPSVSNFVNQANAYLRKLISPLLPTSNPSPNGVPPGAIGL